MPPDVGRGKVWWPQDPSLLSVNDGCTGAPECKAAGMRISISKFWVLEELLLQVQES